MRHSRSGRCLLRRRRDGSRLRRHGGRRRLRRLGGRRRLRRWGTCPRSRGCVCTRCGTFQGLIIDCTCHCSIGPWSIAPADARPGDISWRRHGCRVASFQVDDVFRPSGMQQGMLTTACHHQKIPNRRPHARAERIAMIVGSVMVVRVLQGDACNSANAINLPRSWRRLRAQQKMSPTPCLGRARDEVIISSRFRVLDPSNLHSHGCHIHVDRSTIRHPAGTFALHPKPLQRRTVELPMLTMLRLLHVCHNTFPWHHL